jgi:dTDP-4-dehydrorhamnose reductase
MVKVARALAQAGSALNVEIINLGRPQFDLAVPETVGPALNAAMPDIVVNSAAYTAVDQAEREPDWQEFCANHAGARRKPRRSSCRG